VIRSTSEASADESRDSLFGVFSMYAHAFYVVFSGGRYVDYVFVDDTYELCE